jgi:hypothetical protein
MDATSIDLNERFMAAFCCSNAASVDGETGLVGVKSATTTTTTDNNNNLIQFFIIYVPS